MKSKLDVCWSKEEDENRKIVYYYKPDNYSSYEHPHLYRLKNAIYDFREEENKQLERDNMEKNIVAMQQIRHIKQTKAALKKERDNLKNQKADDEEPSKTKSGKKKGKKGGKKGSKAKENSQKVEEKDTFPAVIEVAELTKNTRTSIKSFTNIDSTVDDGTIDSSRAKDTKRSKKKKDKQASQK